MKTPVASPVRSAPVSPGATMMLLAFAGWMAFMIWPRLLVLVGINSFGRWFLDSYAVLAAIDALRAGLDPTAPNPLDALGRDHKYSDWWFALRWLGVTRESNFLMGSIWGGAFAAAVWRTVRPRSYREAIWLAVLLVSPPVMLAVQRANNDLVIFAVLAVGGVAAAGPGLVWLAGAVAALVVATGLKFYPAVAALAFIWIRPVRRMPGALLAALAAVALVLASLWPQLKRGQFSLPATLHTMGAPILWRDLGWAGPGMFWVGMVLIVLVAAGLARAGITTGLAAEGEPRERLLAALGAIVVLACFAVSINYAYRWIFALWPALWLGRRAADPGGPPARRWAARVGCLLLLACFWLDGILCIVVNQFFAPVARPSLEHLQLVWRLWTQPLHWLLMMLLAGWLLEAALAIGREWLADRTAR